MINQYPPYSEEEYLEVVASLDAYHREPIKEEYLLYNKLMSYRLSTFGNTRFMPVKEELKSIDMSPKFFVEFVNGLNIRWVSPIWNPVPSTPNMVYSSEGDMMAQFGITWSVLYSIRTNPVSSRVSTVLQDRIGSLVRLQD